MRPIRLFAPIVTWHDSWASSSRLPWRGYRRGILRGRFPTISPLVDTANVLAAERLIPIGLFDLDRIQGAVELTPSTPGEAFASIGQGEPVALPDGTSVLRDALGVFSAIGTRDSARTRIVADITDLLVVSWGFLEVDATLIDATLDEYVERVQVGRRMMPSLPTGSPYEWQLLVIVRRPELAAGRSHDPTRMSRSL